MKRLLTGLIVLLVLLTGFGIAAHVLIDRSALRDDVVAAVKRQTGRDLALGRFSVQVLPWPSVSAGNVVLSDLPGSARGPMLKAREVRASIALTPLFWREIRLENVTVLGADVSLLRDTDGRANWEFTPPKTLENDHSSSRPRVQARWKLAIGSASLTQANLSWRDELRSWRGHVVIDRAELDGLHSPSPYIDFHGHHDRTPFTLTGHIGPLSLLRGENPPWALSLGATLGTNETHQDWLNFDGQLMDPQHLRGLAGNLRGEIAHLSDLHGIFPHARLPEINDLGGELGLFDAETKTDTQGWKAFASHLGVNHVHLHAASLPSWHDIHAQAVHVDGETLSSALAVDADLASASHVWHAQGQFGTLSQALRSWQDRLNTPLPVSVTVQEPGKSGLEATDQRDRNDGATFNVSGHIGAKESQLALSGQAQSLAIRNSALHEAKFGLTIEAKGWRWFHLKDSKFSSQEAEWASDLIFDDRERRKLSGSVHVSRLDLDALQGIWRRVTPPVKPQIAPSVPAAPGVAGIAQKSTPAANEAKTPIAPSTQTPPLSLVQRLRQQDADLTFEGDNVRFNQRDYHALKTHVSLQAGHLTLDPISGQGPDGPLAGRFDYHAENDDPEMAAQFSPLLLPASWAQQQAGLPLLLRGPLEVVGEVHARGQQPNEWRHTMSGHLGLSMVGGTIDSHLLGQFVGQDVQSVLGHGDIGLGCLGIHANIADNRAVVDSLGLEAGALMASGHGDFNLTTHEMTLHLTPRVGIAGAGASTPVLVTGTIEAPHVQQEAGQDGRFEVTIGGAAEDVCGHALSAAREGLAGQAPPVPKKRSRAAELLHDLGIFH
ncbi:AsmA family protein [Kozakia baliensis]|uniref:AsmA family protein n=1 Tax=Kozakia baliensis TaxID=153496 RepID=UPI000496E955|nr:AsmA family protein [Kozakia baliensis]